MNGLDLDGTSVFNVSKNVIINNYSASRAGSSECWIRAVANTAMESIMVFDNRGNTIFLNDKYGTFNRFTARSTRNYNMVLNALSEKYGNLDVAHKSILDVYAYRISVSFIITITGTESICLCKAAPVIDDREEFLGIVISATRIGCDISGVLSGEYGRCKGDAAIMEKCGFCGRIMAMYNSSKNILHEWGEGMKKLSIAVCIVLAAGCAKVDKSQFRAEMVNKMDAPRVIVQSVPPMSTCYGMDKEQVISELRPIWNECFDETLKSVTWNGSKATAVEVSKMAGRAALVQFVWKHRANLVDDEACRKFHEEATNATATAQK